MIYGLSLLDLTNNAEIVSLFGEGTDTDVLASVGRLDPGNYFLGVSGRAGVVSGLGNPLV